MNRLSTVIVIPELAESHPTIASSLVHTMRSSFARYSNRKRFWPVLLLASVLVFGGRLRAQTGDTAGHPMIMGMTGTARTTAFRTPGGATLDVHPAAMPLGTTNPAAGEHTVGTDGNAILSVSPHCVGAHRCPLFIFLPGAGQQAAEVTAWLRPVADKYGMILLTLTQYDPPHLRRALRTTLATYAIDPARIAVIGRCASGGAGMRYGLDNPDVFSRIALISGPAVPSGPETTAQKGMDVLIDGGILEADETFAAAKKWRADGHPVTVLLGLRGHEHQVEDYDFLGRWLTDTWAHPNPAIRIPPAVVADPLPVLTTDALTKLTTFWTLFSQEPDSVLNTARRAYLREVVIPVGHARPSFFIMDMRALAAHAPAVAADLQRAGLTAQEHDAYRAALISAQTALVLRRTADDSATVQALLGDLTTSVLGRNMAFMEGHRQEVKTLAHAGIAHAEKLENPALGGDAPALPPGVVLPPGFPPVSVSYPRPNPAMVKDYGPMGIWRTP
jgi:hypothetical protein